jgi:hypothetical protein
MSNLSGGQTPVLPSFTLDDLNANSNPTGQRLGIGRTSILLELAARNALEYQFLREIVENGLEAGATEIKIDADWVEVARRTSEGRPPVYRLGIWNNGPGMTPTEMTTYLGNIMQSSKSMGVLKNHGGGARGACAYYNPHGMIWMSWINGVGFMVWLMKDPKSGEFMLKEFNFADGSRSLVAPVPPAYDFMFHKDRLGQKVRRQNGVLVLFLGQHEDDHTYIGFAGEGRKRRSGKVYQRELNRRYFRFPKGVDLWAWEAPGRPSGMTEPDPIRDGWPTVPTRSCRRKDTNISGGQGGHPKGCKYYWDMYSIASGSTKISDAVVHWWVNDGKERGGLGSYTWNFGVCAALWKDEVYHGNTSDGRFRQFGVPFSKARRRIVLMVEPNTTFPLVTDMSRGALKQANGEGLPWRRWGLEFRDNMPQAILDMIDDVNPANVDFDALETTLNGKIAEIAEDMGLLRGGKQPGGGGGGGGGGGNPLPPGPVPPPIPPPITTTPPNGNPTPGKGSKGRSKRIPPVIRFNQVDENPARPASYDDTDPCRPVLWINVQHEHYRTLVLDLAKDFTSIPGVEDEISKEVACYYSILLATSILEALRYRTSLYKRHWSLEAAQNVLSDESLAFAVCGYQHRKSIRTRLKQRL